ncbi:MAG: hypothetical protein IKO84_09835 [Butyrivibrio sp.]|nr:hypothetical protein [Butyrivibrio sp.]
MKKSIVVILIATMIAFGVVGCGKAVAIEPAALNTSTGFSLKSADDTVLGKKETSTSSASETSSSNGEFTSGEIKDNVYENTFFNVKFPVADDMVFADSVKLAELNNTVIDTLDNKGAKETVKNGNPMVVAYAENARATSFNVAITSAGKLATAVFNEKKVLEANRETVVKEFEGMGLSDVTTSVEKTTFLGEEHDSLIVRGKIQGQNFSQKMIILIKDGYMAAFTISGLSEDSFSLFDGATKIE